jgi:hypothetical protein
MDKYFYPVADDRNLLLALLDEIGQRYDDIRPTSDPVELSKWAHRLLVQWSEEYAAGYHQEPRKR